MTSSEQPLMREFTKSAKLTDPEKLEDVSLDEPPPSRHSYSNRLMPWVFHALILCIYTAIIFRRDYTPSKITKTELKSVESYIEYEDVVLEGKAAAKNLYKGMPTPEINARWEELYKVGIIGLTKAENDQLPVQAAVSFRDPDLYPAVVSVFHHIHCLDQIRLAAWENEGPGAKYGMRMADRCIDYLRQVLLCQADTTPMPLYVGYINDRGNPMYDTDWDVQYQCRNKERIREWAIERQHVL